MGKNNSNQKVDAITTTLVESEPNLVGWTLTQRDLEETVTMLLTEKNVSFRGTTVSATIDKTGQPMLEQYVFFNTNDKASILRKGGMAGSAHDINPALLNKIGTGGVRLQDHAFQAMRTIALPDGGTRAMPARNGLTVVPVDPYKVISYCLSAAPGIYKVILTGMEIRNDIIYINAIKRLERGGFNPRNTSDEFARALEQIGRGSN